MIERSGDDVCSLHHAQGDEERQFLSLASKPRSMVSWFDLKTKVDGFSRFGLKTGGFGFPSLGLKIVSYNLVIWASKSPWRFFGLGLKTKRAMVCRLHHKTDGWIKTMRDTRRYLAACFAWK
jgi:hypothetical protein